MRAPARRPGLLAGENGFTLPEMMVTMVIMVVVLFSLYSIFDMSLKVFSFGNDKVEAVENARIGLAKMERELRAAFPYDKTNSSTADDHLFFNTSNPAVGAMPSSAQITFGNDLSAASSVGHQRVQCPGLDGSCEFITYKLVATGTTNSPCTVAPCTLRRVNTANSADAGEPVADFVVPNGLTFTYLKADGSAATTESEIKRVVIRLSINVKGRTQVLTTNVDLRNRGL